MTDGAEPGDTNRVSTTVVQAVADATGTAVTDLPPLASAIDGDALDALFADPVRGDVTVRFQYHGYTVVVHGPEDIELD